MWQSIMDWIGDFLDMLLLVVLSFLPKSPFAYYINSLQQLPFLGYLNWFVPVRNFLVIGTAWLTAIGLFYMAKIAMRWIKAIQ